MEVNAVVVQVQISTDWRGNAGVQVQERIPAFVKQLGAHRTKSGRYDGGAGWRQYRSTIQAARSLKGLA